VSLLPEATLNADDDYMEEFRGYWYPRLHPLLDKYTPAYGKASVSERQLVGTVDVTEETLEEELVDIGFVRNPLAAYKIHEDGRESEGSWVLLEEHDEYDIIDPGMQLHLTLFKSHAKVDGRAIYAHYEDDWRVSPLAHLRSENLSGAVGAQKAHRLLDAKSFVEVKD
jgi:hypothetical protein